MTVYIKNSFTLSAALAFAVMLALMSLAYPSPSWDLPTYSYIGNLILEGGAPYRDALDTKNPGIFFAYAFKSLVLGKSVLAVRVFDLLWQIGTAVALGALAVRVYGVRAAAWLAGLFYIISYYTQGFWNWVQPDGWLTLPLALAFLAVCRTRPLWLLAGVLVALAALLKVVIGLVGIILLVQAWRSGLRISSLWMLAVGFVVPLALCVLYFNRLGAVDEFISAQFVLGPVYARRMWELVSLECYAEVLRRPLNVPTYLMMLAATILAFWRRKVESYILLWLVIACIAVTMQGRFASSHMIMLFGPLSILCASAVTVSLTRPRRVALVSLAALFVIVPAAQMVRHSQVLISRLSGHHVDHWKPLGERIRDLTAPDDTIFVWGNVPAIYMHAERKAASRFLAAYFVAYPWPGLDYRKVFLAEFAASQPRYLVLVKDRQRGPCPVGPGADMDLVSAFDEFTELQVMLRADYTVEGEREDYALYRRNAAPKRQ